MKGTAAWGSLLFLAIVLIIAGFQGSAGRILAVVFCPDELTVTP